MGAQYVVDENGKHIGVILPIEEYERLIEELEELDDVKAAEEARREIETGADELIPWEQAKRDGSGKSSVEARRGCMRSFSGERWRRA